MRLTIRRIKLNRDGYDSQGRYWGAGERFYYCPTIDESGARERAWPHNAVKSACRAPDVTTAREIFQARLNLAWRCPICDSIAPRVARHDYFICPECAALPREAP